MKKTPFLFCILTPALTLAALHEVHPGESIQQAVDQAQTCDTVLIHDGHYTETVVLYGKTLTIGSLFLIDGDTAHVESTVIEPDSLRSDTGSCFVYVYGESIEGRLCGLTLTHGRGTWWDSVASDYAGGAVFVREAGLTLDHCVIVNSSAYYGGGLAVSSAQYTFNAEALVRDCTFRNCRAEAWGGGVYGYWSSLRIVRSTFEYDTSVAGGGGVCSIKDRLIADSCVFRYCGGYIPGLACLENMIRIAHCQFEENGSSGSSPCHLLAGSPGALITGCVFRANRTGVLSLILAGTRSNPLSFVGNVVEDHYTSTITGTIILNGYNDDIGYNVIRNNVNFHGGAMWVQAGNRPRIHHNYITGNVSHDPTVGSVLASTCLNSGPELASNWIEHNTSPVLSYQVCPPYQLRIHAENNWWGDPSGPYHPTRNPGGRGDTLLQDSIYFEPWLTSPPDTSMPSAANDRTPPEVRTTWELLALYPNPFNREIRIVLAGFTGNDFRLTLHNLLGQEVEVLHVGALTGNELIFRAPDGLASGVYFLRAADERAVQSRKIVLLK